MHALHSLAPILILSLVSLAATAVGQEAPFLAGEVKVGERTFPYRLLPPEDMVPGQSYPLVLFLHGAGERGSDNEKQLMHFPERMAEPAYRSKYPCFVLAPQCPEEETWVEVEWSSPESTPIAPEPASPMLGAVAALEEVVRAHPIDLDRIYLTGLSMGGYGTWDLATRHPGWFAAAAPICGGGDERMAAKLAGLPLSVWHGGADQVVPPRRSRVMVEALESLGGEVQYHELEGVGHGSWVRAYDPDGCLEWLFEARHDPNAELAAAARLMAGSLAPNEHVAFLGNSITQSGDKPGGYVDLLREVLTISRPEAIVIPAGVSGHTVPDLLARYERDVIESGATLVFVYIGINDVWHSKFGRGTPAKAYEDGLRTLLRALIASGADVVLATPSVIGEQPTGSNELDAMLDEYAALVRTVAAEEGATLCDLQRAFRDHLRVRNPRDADKQVLTKDGVHLNQAGNVFVATQAARALRQAALRRQE